MLLGLDALPVGDVAVSQSQPVDVIVMTVVKYVQEVVDFEGLSGVTAGAVVRAAEAGSVGWPVTRPTAVVEEPVLVLKPTLGTVAVREDQLIVVHGSSGSEVTEPAGAGDELEDAI